LIKIFRSYTPNLQKFNCELYFHAWDDEDDIIDIQQLHPLFKIIQCHSGSGVNRCYATDLPEYPPYSEYSCKYRRSFYKPTVTSLKYHIILFRCGYKKKLQSGVFWSNGRI
jgi:hypothetical protein